MGHAVGRVANADQSRHVMHDKNTSNLDSDWLQNSKQTTITAIATKVANTFRILYIIVVQATVQKQKPSASTIVVLAQILVLVLVLDHKYKYESKY